MTQVATVLLFCLVVLGPLAFIVLRKKLLRARWSEASDLLGIDYNGNLGMRGSCDGVPLQVNVVFKAHANPKTVWSARTLTPLPAGLKILAPGPITTKLADTLGTGEQLGIADLEGKLIVHCDDSDEVRAWASRPEVEAVLRELLEQDAPFEIRDWGVMLEESGHVTSVTTLVQRGVLAVDLARRLSRDPAL